MTEVATNFNINMTEVTANIKEVEGLQPAEVDAILKMAGDGAIWKSMEGQMSEGVTAAAQNKQLVGGPTPTSVKCTGSHVIEVAKFAVREHNKQAMTDLVFVKLVALCEQVVPRGIFYFLLIDTKDGMEDPHRAVARGGHKGGRGGRPPPLYL